MLWSDVHYTDCEIRDPRADAFLAAIRNLYANGRVLFRCFQPTVTEAFRSAADFDRHDLAHRLRAFLVAPTIRAMLKELELPPLSETLPGFHYCSAYEMEGALVATLLRGGAYNKFPGTEDEARRLARDFVSVIGHQHSEVFEIVEEAWTSWFYNVAWDLSFVVLNSRQLRWWILCMTDTD